MTTPLLFFVAGLLVTPATQAQWVSQAVPLSQSTSYLASLQARAFTPAGWGTQEITHPAYSGTTWRTANVPGLAPAIPCGGARRPAHLPSG